MSNTYPSKTNIYEHGILIEGDQDEDPESLRVIATTRLPIYAAFTLCIVDFEGRSLNERAAQLAYIQGPHRTIDYYEENDVKYCVIATLYHLNRIIDLYVSVCQIFEHINLPGTAISGNMSDPRVFYEIDAFFGAARRVYDSMRKVLWKHYYGHRETGRWRSIRSVIDIQSPHNIPLVFLSELRESWNTFGERITDYRDCVMHNDPLTDGNTTCFVELYENRCRMTIQLPANPEVKSRRVFDFDSGPEALSYCHSVACHLVELCELLEAQTEVASYLANPRLDR